VWIYIYIYKENKINAIIRDQGIGVVKTDNYIFSMSECSYIQNSVYQRESQRRKLLVSLHKISRIEALILLENKMKKSLEYLHPSHIS